MGIFKSIFSRDNIGIKIFIFVSILLLILPILHINTEKDSFVERRFLALYKPFYDESNKKINTNYGKDFENYLKDRFLGRVQLINLNSDLKLFLAKRYVMLNSKYVDKLKKNVFDNPIIKPLSPKYCSKISKELELFDEYCRRHNIKLYVVVNPQQEMIYAPEIINNDINIQKVKNNIKKINNKSSVKIIFPINEYLQEKIVSSYPLYFKTDTHATMDGTFVGYYALMNEIKKDFPDIKIFNKSDFYSYFSKSVMFDEDRKFDDDRSCIRAGISLKGCQNMLKTDYKYYTHRDKDALDIKFVRTKMINKKEYSYSKVNNLNLMVFGDSFMENLMDIVPYSFQHTVRIRLNQGRDTFNPESFKILKHYKKDIENYAPDIIVIYVSYLSLKHLREFASEK